MVSLPEGIYQNLPDPSEVDTGPEVRESPTRPKDLLMVLEIPHMTVGLYVTLWYLMGC